MKAPMLPAMLCASGLFSSLYACTIEAPPSSGGRGQDAGMTASGGAVGSTGGGTSTSGGTVGTGASPSEGGSGTMDDAGSDQPPALEELAAALDGQTYTLTCGSDTSYSRRVCNNRASGQTTCPSNPDYIFAGTINKDETITFGGDSGSVYNVTIKVRGIVEPKNYLDGQQGPGGWYVGGRPSTQNAYNVYVIRVDNPTEPDVDYFLNSINQPLQHSTHVIDYEATFPVEGSASLRLIASDSNCQAIKNCSPPENENVCTQQTVQSLVTDHPEISQPVVGQFIVLDVVTVVEG